jgi:hypothetical protein
VERREDLEIRKEKMKGGFPAAGENVTEVSGRVLENWLVIWN